MMQEVKVKWTIQAVDEQGWARNYKHVELCQTPMGFCVDLAEWRRTKLDEGFRVTKWCKE